MIEGADSSDYHPTLQQLQAAYAQGVRVWGCYLPGPGIYSGNTKDDFDRIHAAGMKSIGWASGWSDPIQIKALAASWGVDYPTLDCEDGIRGKGVWTQPWLDQTGFGLYMPYGTDGSAFNGMVAPWFIMAGYYGAPPYNDPHATWKGSAPSVPHGWQWAGTVNAYGGTVDRLWLDDFFLGQSLPMPEDEDILKDLLITWPDGHLQAIRLSGSTIQQSQADSNYQWSLWKDLTDPAATGFDRLVGYGFAANSVEVHAVKNDLSSWHFRSADGVNWTGWQYGDS